MMNATTPLTDKTVMTESLPAIQPSLIPNIASEKSVVYLGDAYETLKRLPSAYFQTAVTSPPYWGLRDYGAEGQIGSEENLKASIGNLVRAMSYRPCRR